MKNLIINGDPGIRKDAVIEYDGEEVVCFSVKRQGDWHGPDRVQLWCTIGTEDEREAYERREYIPMHIPTEHVDAEAVTVVTGKGDLAV
ncbi:HAH_0734 family protein [Halomarina ordinaria]|uniref:HAH_0734 family protein n=1 Tax=Halomarina ordinaria TaxID=3033939 RepID=A0ABD5U6S9_9EURY|nr:HAH_0734 family protein [Halomarina sp. PSRA2]